MDDFVEVRVVVGEGDELVIPLASDTMYETIERFFKTGLCHENLDSPGEMIIEAPANILRVIIPARSERNEPTDVG